MEARRLKWHARCSAAVRRAQCKEKEVELAEKQDKIRESVIRFEKFVKENDAKRTRALKREKDEISLRTQKEAELRELKSSMHEHTKLKHKLLRQCVPHPSPLPSLSVH